MNSRFSIGFMFCLALALIPPVAGNGLLVSESSLTVTNATLYFHDAFGRPVEVRNPQGFSAFTTYDPGTGRVTATTDAATNTTAFAYYPNTHANAGELKTRTDANGKQTHYAYNGRGQVTHLWGDVPYPQRMFYNQYGELVTLHTFRGGAGWTGSSWPTMTGTPDITMWEYQGDTGLLLSKTDGQGRKVQHTYTYYDLPLNLIWARGVTSTNSYNNLGDLVKIEYDETTPNVEFSNFDRRGRPRTIIDGNGTERGQR